MFRRSRCVRSRSAAGHVFQCVRVFSSGRLETPSGETQFARGHDYMVHCRHCFHQCQIFNKLEDPQFNFHSVPWDHWG